MVDHSSEKLVDSENNVYAYDIEENVIHISEAKSGRRGYFCLGCKRELQAVKSKIIGRISYFRHDPKAVKITGKCTYRDETYRHKLAKDIAQRIKQIKVPALYKYPPKNQEGAAMLLQDSKTIRASKVGIERVFYENEFGEIEYDKKEIDGGQYLLVKPDITFFNSKGKPILFVEVVATHKIGVDKLVKLKRLGIDTVQVRIPKDSPEKIEQLFYTTIHTKWVYNYVEENTEYIRVSGSDSEGIPPIDEQQRKLFEESTRCRLAQIWKPLTLN